MLESVFVRAEGSDDLRCDVKRFGVEVIQLPRGAAQVKLQRPVRLHCLNRLWLYRSVLLKLWHNTAPLQLRKLRLSHVQRQTIVLQYLRHVMYSSIDRVLKTHLD